MHCTMHIHMLNLCNCISLLAPVLVLVVLACELFSSEAAMLQQICMGVFHVSFNADWRCSRASQSYR